MPKKQKLTLEDLDVMSFKTADLKSNFYHGGETPFTDESPGGLCEKSVAHINDFCV